MFRKKKRRFFVPTDGSGPIVTYDYDQVKSLVRARRIKSMKVWAFWIVVAVALIQVFTSVLSGNVLVFKIEVVVVMTICGIYGIYQAHKTDRSWVWVAMVNAIAVACYAIGTFLLVRFLFQQSDTFRQIMASVTGHESFNGSRGIVGHTPWYLMLFSLGFVVFLVYGLMVISIVASLSGLMHVGDKKYIGEKPKKPKRKKLEVKRNDEETDDQFASRQQEEVRDYAKAIKSSEWHYRNELVLWRYRKFVATGLAPIWLSLIAVACSMLYISESYFNAAF